jgi:hypothetical protein
MPLRRCRPSGEPAAGNSSIMRIPGMLSAMRRAELKRVSSGFSSGSSVVRTATRLGA